VRYASFAVEGHLWQAAVPSTRSGGPTPRAARYLMDEPEKCLAALDEARVLCELFTMRRARDVVAL
jgi:hypothetical protein